VDRSVAERLDEQDELAHFRGRFVIDDPDLIYLDGNSLGRLPRVTAARLRDAVEREWGRDLIRSWDRWLGLPAEVGDLIGSAFLGAGPGQVVVADSTTVNFYKLARAALAPGQVVVTTRGNFPTDRYVLEALAARGNPVRWIDGEAPTPDDIGKACTPGDVGLVTVSHVSYRSGALVDAEAITATAHAHNARVLLDLSHSAGAVPIHLDDWAVDLAVGCSYKYLNGGPGSPAFLYVRGDLQDQLDQPIPGWFGAADQFAMGPSYRPAPGATRFLSGTPHILGLIAVHEGVKLLAEAGIGRLRTKGIALTEMVVQLHDEWLAPLGMTLATPRDPRARGSHIGIRHTKAEDLCRILIERHHVIPDFRTPDVIRIGPAPITATFGEVWDALAILRDCALQSLQTK
jgi:kynureninase